MSFSVVQGERLLLGWRIPGPQSYQEGAVKMPECRGPSTRAESPVQEGSVRLADMSGPPMPLPSLPGATVSQINWRCLGPDPMSSFPVRDSDGRSKYPRV